MKDVTSSAQALDDLRQDRVEKVSESLVQEVRDAPEQVSDLNRSQAGYDTEDGIHGTLPSQNLVEREAGIQQVCDAAQKIAEKTGVIVGSDLQADGACFDKQAQQVEVDRAQFQIEDRTRPDICSIRFGETDVNGRGEGDGIGPAPQHDRRVTRSEQLPVRDADAVDRRDHIEIADLAGGVRIR